MADNKQVYIDLQVRAEQAEKSLADIVAKLAAMKQQQRDIQKQLNENIKAQRQAAASIDELERAYNSGAIAEDDYRAKVAAATAAQEAAAQAAQDAANGLAAITPELQQLTAEYKTSQREVALLQKAHGDSLNALRSQLALLTADYDKLSEDEREAASGQELQKKISDLNAEVLSMEESTGRFQRNVGNYQSVWDATSEKLEGFGKIISKIFGSDSVITQSVTHIIGFGKALKDLPTDSTTSAVSGMANATAQASASTAQATRQTIGFRTAQQQAAQAAQQTTTTEAAQAGASATLSTAFRGVTTAIGSATKAALKFIATPIGAVIAAVAAVIAVMVAAFKQLKDAIGRSDDAGTAFESLMARFHVVGNALKNVFTALADAIAPAVEWLSKFAGRILNLIPGLKEINEAQEEVIRSTDELENLQRKQVKTAAENKKRQAELEIVYNDSTKSVEERAKALQTSVEIEAAAAKEQLRIAKMQLNIKLAQLRANKDTSDAAKDEVAKLEAAVTEAEAAVTQATASATKKLSSFRKEQQEKAAEAAKKRKESLKKAEEELTKIVESNAKSRVELLDNEYLRAELLEQHSYEKRLSELRQRLAQQEAIRSQYAKRQGSEEYKNATQQAKELNTAIELLTEQHNATLLALTEKHQQETNQVRSSNEELRLQLITDGNEREMAAYELHQRQLDEAAADRLTKYNETKAEIAKAMNDGRITAAQARDKLKAEEEAFLADIEAINIKSQQNTAEHLKARYEANTKELDKNLKGINKAYQDVLAETDKNDYEARSAALDQKYESLKELYENMASLSEADAERTYGSLDAWREKVEELKKAYKDAAKEVEANAEAMAESTRKQIESTLQATQQLTSAVASLYQGEFERIINSNEELTEQQKQQALSAAESQYHATMAGIILNQAQGIAATYTAGAKAMAETVGGPAVKIAAMVAVIASGIANLLSGISQAKTATETFNEQKEKIAGMATGGYVQGAGTATSDSVPARLSNGESVLTARATAAHYDTLSRWNVEGGGRPFPGTSGAHFAHGGVAVDYGNIAAAMRHAVTGVKTYVAVTDFNQGERSYNRFYAEIKE